VSNSLAIFAVTATMRDILNLAASPLPFDPDPDPDLNDVTCSVKPPDKARTAESQNQLNLFLYQTSWNAALRNADLVRTVRPNETAMTPVALTLYYLITSYGKNNDDLLAHRILGRAMSLLHDQAILLPGAIQATGKGNDLWKQVERVRIVPHAISGEELFRLWATFQTPYRISATYEVSVVLIDSVRRARVPLPVLTRVPVAQGGMVPAFPELAEISLPLAHQPAARLPSPAPPAIVPGDVVTLAGHDLLKFATSVLFSNSLLATPIARTPLVASTAASVQVDLPSDQTIMPAGVYTVSVRVSQSADPTQDRTSNGLPVAIAPRIRTITTAARVGGLVPVTVLLSPQVWPTQRVALLVGDAQIPAQSFATKTDTVEFRVPLPAGSYLVRVRVDGVDSFLIDFAASPLAYDPTQTVVLPP
jgi:hypothetical protein